jgi:predicted nucleotidyltransferase component of viral defense system
MINEEYFINNGLTQNQTKKALLLYNIAKTISNENLVLKGGTSLLFGHNLTRFSSDLDYDGLGKINIMEKVIKTLKDNKVHYSNIYDKKYYDKITNNLKESHRILYGKEDSIKIEIDYNTNYIDKKENKEINNGIYMYNKNTLTELKYNAFTDRTKARDLFDIAYLLAYNKNGFTNGMLKGIYDKYNKVGKDNFKKLFKEDEILRNYNTDKLFNYFEKTIIELNSSLNVNSNNVSKKGKSR